MNYYFRPLVIRNAENKARCKIFFFLTGEVFNQAYFPVLVPVGIVGNILSFLVSIDSLKSAGVGLFTNLVSKANGKDST